MAATYQQRKFSPAVEKALQEVCPSDDPMDATDFDPIAFLNTKFPDEESLKGFNDFYDDIKKKKQQAESALLTAVKTQATTAGSAAKDLEDAQAAVINLHQRVSEIKNKAAESEQKVQELCSNIRQLDIAKTNISTSVKTLKKLQLWILQVKDLQAAATAKNYSACHDSLKSANEHSAFFEAYSDIPKINELRETMARVSRQLEWNIQNLFGAEDSLSGGSGGANHGAAAEDDDTLREACLVADVIGPEAYKQIIKKYIAKEMDAYEKKYTRGSDSAEFRRTANRYSYFMDRLDKEEHLLDGVFPAHWCVRQELSLAFCLKTRTELEYSLKVAEFVDVNVLTFVMERTIQMENELTSRCRVKGKIFDADGNEIRVPEYKFNNMMLQCFDAHMSQYVDSEEKALRNLLQPIIPMGSGVVAETEFLGVNDATNGATLPSSDDIFVFIAERLQLAKSLSQRQTLMDVAMVWLRELQEYSTALRTTMKVLISQGATSSQSGGSSAASPSGTTAGAGSSSGSSQNGLDFARLAMITNTANFCRNTIETIKDSFLNPEEGHIESIKGGPAVDVGPLETAFDMIIQDFTKLYSEGVGAAVGAIKTECVKYLWEAKYPLLPPEADSHQGDVSAYVMNIKRTLINRTSVCARVLDMNVLPYFLDKLAHEVVDTFATGLFRPGVDKIPAEVIGRLRVDSKALRAAVLQLPNAGDPDRFQPAALSRYNARVNRNFDRHDNNLKILHLPISIEDKSFPETYLSVTHPSDASIYHFERLLALKGVPRDQLRSWTTMLAKREVPDGRPKDKDGKLIDAPLTATTSSHFGSASPNKTSSILGGGLLSGSSNIFGPSTSQSNFYGGGSSEGTTTLPDAKAIMGVFKGGAKAFTGAAAKFGTGLANIGKSSE